MPGDRLERARQYLVIAESGDAKTTAYRAAAEEIAAYLEEEPEATQASLARDIERSKTYVYNLLRWRESGYEASSPFTMGGEADGRRAGVSHARKVLRERPAEVAAEIAEALADPEVHAIVEDKTRRSTRLTQARIVNAADERRLEPAPDPAIRDAQRPRPRVVPPPDPWKPFWQAMRLLDEVAQNMHPEAWGHMGVVGFNAAIGVAAGQKAEFLAALAATAQEKAAAEAAAG